MPSEHTSAESADQTPVAKYATDKNETVVAATDKNETVVATTDKNETVVATTDKNETVVATTDNNENAVATAELADAAQENETVAMTAALELALPPQFQNLHANGGAVAAVFLGVLCIFGAFITPWSLFNAALGLILGLWGLKSRLSKTSRVGIGLCCIGAALCWLR